MKKIGILGGSFNPIHVAHLLMAEQAREQFRLERVLFIPARMPPHKHESALAPGKERLEMVRLAIEGNAAFEALDIELLREGPSYTILTIEALRERYGADAELYFLIGLDTVNELATWREIGRLATLCKFVPLDRPGAREPSIEALTKIIGEIEAQAIVARRVRMPLMEISSSDIRARIASGRSIRYLVPQAVEEHIHRLGLYRGATSSEPSRPPRCCGGASRRS